MFTIAGLIAVGGCFAVYFYFKRRAARLRDEEETYFEKYTAENANSSSNFQGHTTPEDMSFHGGLDNATLDEAPMTVAAADAYPDRATHFGLPTMDEYSSHQPMGLNFNSGVEYPPGMTYDPYNQGQYGNYENGYNYNTGTDGQGYYDHHANASARAPTSPTHPYANPSNSPVRAAAPPVQQQYYNAADVTYGEAR